jgi:hypothetical protein
MDTAQSTQHRRSIKVKDFLEDFRSGASDDQLMEKYQLSATGLERFYGMLVERGILDSEETQSRLWDDSPAFAEAPREGDSAWSQGDEAAAQGAAAPEENRASSPIEIPLAEDGEAGAYFDSADESATERFGAADDMEEGLSEFGAALDADPVDEVVSGMPLDFVDRREEDFSEEAARCPHCDHALDVGTRESYDRSMSIKALAFSLLFLVLGALGAWAVTQFSGYSVIRLAVIYFTGMTMLTGCGLLALAIFMLFLARERVFVCYSCLRAYPRL